MSDFSAVLPALSAMLDRVGQGPLEVSVSLTDSQTVIDLKSQVSELQTENELLKTRVNRAEFSVRCNSVITMRIVDYCREKGIKIPRRLYEGLDEF